MRPDELIAEFVASFAKFDEMAEFPETVPLVRELSVGNPDSYGRLQWAPLKYQTDPSHLQLLQAKLPAQFPLLFQELVLTYRWAEVDLRSFRLLANPPGPDLSGLLKEMSKAPAFWEHLPRAGYIQFGRGPDTDYDPVCFDIRSRSKRKDYKVVRIDHEEILCNNRVRVVAEIAPSFEQLVIETIERGRSGNQQSVQNKKGRAG